MNILNVLKFSPTVGGGIVQHLDVLGRVVKSSGHKLLIAFPKKRDWQAELETISEVIIIPAIENPFRSGFPAILRKLCNDKKIDVVHFHFYFSLPFSLAFSLKKWDLPVIQHWHNPPAALNDFLTPPDKVKGQLKRIGAGLIARFTDRRVINRHISISHEISTLLVKNGWTDKRKITLLPNGVPVITYKDKDLKSKMTSTPIIGMVANFRPQKDHFTLLMAFNILFKSKIQSELWLVGDGPTKPEIETLSKKLGVDSRIRFLGTISNPSEVYSKFDIFVLSSHFEGHPLVALEAMSFGLPIVATRISGIQETITHNVNGFLVKPRDPQDLAEALKKLLADQSLAKRLGEEARKSLAKYPSINDWCNQVLEIYKDVIWSYYKTGLVL